jgi:hypothetical protein
MVKQLHRDLNAGRVSDAAATGLYLTGVKYVIFRDRYQWFTPELAPSGLFTIQDGILRTTHATPLLASTRLVSIKDVPGYPSTDVIRQRAYLDRNAFDYKASYFPELIVPLIDRMHIDMDRGVAGALIARDDGLQADLGVPDALQFAIEDFSTDLKRVNVRYRSNMDAIGQLPFNYFPYLDVEVDGSQVSFHRSAMNSILLRVPAGTHVVTIHGVAPPMQASMLWVSLIAFLSVLVVPRRLLSPLERANQ